MHFQSKRSAAHVQIRQRRADAKKSLRQVPVFIARVGVNPQTQTGVAVERRKEREKDSPFFRIPPRQRSQIHGVMTEIVELRIDRSVGQAAQQRNDALNLGIAPAISF